VKARLKVPVIAEIPALRGKAAKDPAYRLFEEDPDGAIAESFRSMRAALVYSTPGDGCRTVLVTSAVPKEGKTLCSVNLAIAFAQIGQRTLLIDADLRRPMAQRIFELPNTGGLTSVLVHGRDLKEAAVEGPVPGLRILPSGPLPPNPAEMLGSEPMLQLLERIRGEWDRIIIDSPPTCAVSDAIVLAPHVDVVLQVVRAGRSGCREASRSMRQITEVGGRHVGVILNGTRQSGRGYRSYGASDYRRTTEEAAEDRPDGQRLTGEAG
jgi:succinoglycan biosynthesis transport protein ExoP